MAPQYRRTGTEAKYSAQLSVPEPGQVEVPLHRDYPETGVGLGRADRVAHPVWRVAATTDPAAPRAGEVSSDGPHVAREEEDDPCGKGGAHMTEMVEPQRQHQMNASQTQIRTCRNACTHTQPPTQTHARTHYQPCDRMNRPPSANTHGYGTTHGIAS